MYGHKKRAKMVQSLKTDVHDDQHARRPSVSDETISKVEGIMPEDRRVTIRELDELIPNVSKTIIDKMSIEYLKYHKVSVRWVLKMLIENYQRQRVEATYRIS